MPPTSTGYSDISLSGSGDLDRFGVEAGHLVVDAAPDPVRRGQFFGDYTGLDAYDEQAFPIWMDTRDPELFLCPGGTATTPPQVCNGTYSTGRARCSPTMRTSTRQP